MLVNPSQRIINNAPARVLNTAFQVSTTNDSAVSYTVTCATALNLLNLNSSAIVNLQVSSDSTTFTTIGSAGITKALGVSITLSISDTNVFNLQGFVPAGYYVKLTSVLSGGGTSTYSYGSEIIFL